MSTVSDAHHPDTAQPRAELPAIGSLSRFATAFISVIASMGVVYFHMYGSRFYIHSSIGLGEILVYFKQEGLHSLAYELISGTSAVIGLFLIISGYGLSKKYSITPAFSYLLHRFKKGYLYALLIALISTLAAFLIERKWFFSYWHSFALVDGFYDRLPRDRAVVQYWYLALAFTYYLVFVWVRRARSTANLLAWSLLLSYAFGIFLQLQSSKFSVSFLPYASVSFYHSVIGRFPEFVAGMVLARSEILEDACFRFSYTRLLFAMMWVLAGYSLFLNPVSYLSAHFVYSTGLFFLFSQLAGLLARWTVIRRIALFLSGGTFSLYCLHMVVIDYPFRHFRMFVEKLLLSKEITRLVSDLAIFLCCIIVLIAGNHLASLYRLAIEGLERLVHGWARGGDWQSRRPEHESRHRWRSDLGEPGR